MKNSKKKNELITTNETETTNGAVVQEQTIVTDVTEPETVEQVAVTADEALSAQESLQEATSDVSPKKTAKEKFLGFFAAIGAFVRKILRPDEDETNRQKKKKEKKKKVKKERLTFKQWIKTINKENTKAFLLGTGEKRGFLQTFFSYLLLVLFGFVYVYPMLYMLGYSLMSPSDVSNPMVNYLPTSFYFDNYREASQVLAFGKTLWQSIYVSVLPALCQTIACCMVAYGLARFKFPGKKVIFGLILLTFIVPSQLTMLPQVLIYTNLKLIDTVFSFIVPAIFGQGIKSAVFILIFYQFFKGIPDSIIEAAKIDGANSFQIFFKIGIPASVPAILLSFLLSVVWYYNETVLSSIYFGGTVTTLPLELAKFKETYEQIFGSVTTTGKSANEAIYMAGTLLSVLPLLVMYAFTQRFFTDGIDKAGITGE